MGNLHFQAKNGENLHFQAKNGENEKATNQNPFISKIRGGGSSSVVVVVVVRP